jgi:hypothetical protein
MKEYSIEMNKSELHHTKSNVNKPKMNKCMQTKNNDISDKDQTNSDKDQTNSDKDSNQNEYLYQKIKKIDSKLKSITGNTYKNKDNIKGGRKKEKKYRKNNVCNKSNKINKANIKEAFNSIHDIESDVEHNTVKIAKKKLADREAELKRRQLPNVSLSKSFRLTDIQRIVQHTTTSIFDKEKCSLWTGYITNLQNKKKGTYVNFYFRNKKKVALHRLLYANFKGEIGPQDYIKYSCSNKGKCCNVNHIIKFEYNANEDEDEDEDEDENSSTSKNINNGKDNKRKSNRYPITINNFKIDIY